MTVPRGRLRRRRRNPRTLTGAGAQILRRINTACAFPMRDFVGSLRDPHMARSGCDAAPPLKRPIRKPRSPLSDCSPVAPQRQTRWATMDEMQSGTFTGLLAPAPARAVAL